MVSDAELTTVPSRLAEDTGSSNSGNWAQLGSVTVLPPDEDTKPEPDTASSTSTRTSKSSPAPDKNNNKLVFGTGKSLETVSLSGENASSRVEAGHVPPPTNRFDVHIPFATRFSAIDWHTGKSMTGLILVDTRPSMLYATLFNALGDK